MSISRRALLERVAMIGGAGATYLAMEAMGLARASPPDAENFQLPPGSGSGKSVIVLGAGIAGLVAAYELSRAGYRVKLIEALDRIGGRSWTIRGQTRIEQIGRPDQLSNFAPGQYFNAGPARIPSVHRGILSYAKRLGVKLQPFVNSNRNAKWDFGGKVHREARRLFDARGQIGELLAKAIDQNKLDGLAPKGEVEMIRQFLQPYAGLGRDGRYKPDGASGYAVEPGAYAQAPVALDRLGWDELVPNRGIALPYFFELIPDMQATMLEPVGGMDRIAYAIYEQVKPLVQLASPVKEIRQVGGKVLVAHGAKGETTTADYCVCTIPMPVLARIPSDFSPAKKRALVSVPYLKSVKVAFQAPRFWEEDDDIYGGPAWTDRPNENILYPSNDFGSPLGVLVAAYCGGWTGRHNPEAFAALSHEERIRICIDSVEAMHPGRSRLLTNPAQVAWGLVPYMEGVGPQWRGGPGSTDPRPPAYTELARPEGPIVFAGEHLSYAQTWQEGAVLAAHEAMKLIDAKARGKAA